MFKTTHPRWLSNTWLCADREGGHAVLIDSGGPIEPIIARIAAWRLTVTHVLCTHHHHDHVAHNEEFRAFYGCPICGHPAERDLFERLDAGLEDGDEVRSGDLTIRAVHTPGHTLGHLAFLVDEREVFTGDTLFRGSIGGTRAPGHTTYDDIKNSVLEVLMRLPMETVVRPGHMESTTIEREWNENPFIRFWRGLDPSLEQPCTAFEQPATLLVRAADYDGGTKCIVAFGDGSLDVVPGSRVEI